MSETKTLEIPIRGMDCAECAITVQRAIAGVPGVQSVEVYLGAEKAVLQGIPSAIDQGAIRRAVQAAGYEVPAGEALLEDRASLGALSRRAPVLLGLVFVAVLLVAVLGEGLGLFQRLMDWIPWPLWLLAILLGGYPIFAGVIRAARRGQILAHTLMSVGALAAVAVGEWATAAIVVFFMRIGAYVEAFTAERGRRALRDLTAMSPQMARLRRAGQEVEVPVSDVRIGDVVVVRPGEQIPVDGQVLAGRATIDQASITGESMPVEVGPGSHVYAATLAQLGGLRLRATRIGRDSTFGKVIRLVEEAEGNRARVQRLADRFSGYYLPLVAGVAGVTYLLSGNALASVAVLVVACSCSFALATPVAVLASIGASAKRGLLIKGGRALEALADAEVLLIDKTGTLTLGRPRLTDCIGLNGVGEDEVLMLAASAERYSEHPLAEALRTAARERGIELRQPGDFESLPGRGVRARIGSDRVVAGSSAVVGKAGNVPQASELLSQAKSLVYVLKNDVLVGLLAAADSPRQEVPEALWQLRELGLRTIEILTGDHEGVARELGGALGIPYRAGLLPEDKIRIVRAYQAEGRKVIMVGDGVNDAPALAQADVGIAMGAAGADIALEAAHIAIMRDDWRLVPEALRIARRTMRIVRMNIVFTGLYNFAGLSLAAFGFLPPVLAAAAQSLPDLGIMANSSRLLRQR